MIIINIQTLDKVITPIELDDNSTLSKLYEKINALDNFDKSNQSGIKIIKDGTILNCNKNKLIKNIGIKPNSTIIAFQLDRIEFTQVEQEDDTLDIENIANTSNDIIKDKSTNNDTDTLYFPVDPLNVSTIEDLPPLIPPSDGEHQEDDLDLDEIEELYQQVQDQDDLDDLDNEEFEIEEEIEEIEETEESDVEEDGEESDDEEDEDEEDEDDEESDEDFDLDDNSSRSLSVIKDKDGYFSQLNKVVIESLNTKLSYKLIDPPVASKSVTSSTSRQGCNESGQNNCTCVYCTQGANIAQLAQSQLAQIVQRVQVARPRQNNQTPPRNPNNNDSDDADDGSDDGNDGNDGNNNNQDQLGYDFMQYLPNIMNMQMAIMPNIQQLLNISAHDIYGVTQEQYQIASDIASMTNASIPQVIPYFIATNFNVEETTQLIMQELDEAD